MFSTLSDLISDLVVDAVVLIERLVFIVVCDLAWERAVSCSAWGFNSTIKGSSLEGKMCFLGTHSTVLVLCIRKIREAYGSTLEQNDYHSKIGRMEAWKFSRLQLCHVRTVPARLESARFPGDPNAYLMIRLKPSFDETWGLSFSSASWNPYIWLPFEHHRVREFGWGSPQLAQENRFPKSFFTPSFHCTCPGFFVESNFWKSANDPSFEKPSFISCEPIALLSFLTLALSPCRSSSGRAQCSYTWIHPFMFNTFRLLILRTSQNENNKSSDQDCCFQTLNWWKKTNILDQHQLQSPKSQGIRCEVPTTCFVPTALVAPWIGHCDGLVCAMESNIFLENRAPLNGDVGRGI